MTESTITELANTELMNFNLSMPVLANFSFSAEATTAKHHIEQDYQASQLQGYGDIQHFGVATAAFREAGNGDLVAEYFSNTLDFPERTTNHHVTLIRGREYT